MRGMVTMETANKMIHLTMGKMLEKFPTPEEVIAMAESEYPDNGLARPSYERTAFINGCKAIIKRGKDE